MDATPPGSAARPPLFLDLDGVLADFDAHVEALFGRRPAQLPLPVLWGRAAKTPAFFETLPLMPDAHVLWEFCLPFGPTILTGLPTGKWAEPQKRRWVALHLGPDVPVVACMARDKHAVATPGAVLVDDNDRYAERWQAKGGVFVRHVSAADSIEQLRGLGFGGEG